MESLRQQINPNLTAMPNPDQTFQQYIQMLLSQQPAAQKGFSSAFVGTGQQATQPSGMQAGGRGGPTTNITSGLFSQYLGDGGDSSGVGGSSSSTGQGISTAAQDVGFAMMDSPSTFGQLGSLGLGLMGVQAPPGIVMSALANAIGQGIVDSQMDAISNSFGAMGSIGNMGLGGVGSFSDANGNISSISNQGLVDAYDMGMFGVTGSGLAGSGVDGGFGFGGVNASDTGGLGFGGGSLGGFADGGFGGGDSGSSGASEGADGSPGGGY